MNTDQVDCGDRCQLNTYESTRSSNNANVRSPEDANDPATLDASELNKIAAAEKCCGQLIHLNKQSETCNVRRDDKSIHNEYQRHHCEHMSPEQLLVVSGKSERQKQSPCLLDKNITNVNNTESINLRDPRSYPSAGGREKLCASRIMRDYISSLPPEVSIKEQMKRFPFWKSIRTEFICTLIFMIISTGSNVSCALSPTTVDWMEIKSSICIALITCILMNVSNNQIKSYPSSCHLNPCLTLALYITGHNNQCVTFTRFIFLSTVQIFAAIMASSFMHGLTCSTSPEINSASNASSCSPFVIPQYDERLHPSNLFALEFIGSFIVIFTYLSVTDNSRYPRKLSIGKNSKRSNRDATNFHCSTNDVAHYASDYNSHSFTFVAFALVTGHLLTFKLTGASLNPIRIFGPALITNQWSYHWVYWVAPTAASLVASFTYEYIKSSKPAAVVSSSSSLPTFTRENDDAHVNREASTFLPIDLTDDDEDEENDEQSTSSHHPLPSELVPHQRSKSNSIHQTAATCSRINDEGMLMTSTHTESEDEDTDDDHHQHHQHSRAAVSQDKLSLAPALVSPLHEQETVAASRAKNIYAPSETSKSFSVSFSRIKKDNVHLASNKSAPARSINQNVSANKFKRERLSHQSSSSSSSTSSPSTHTMTELKLISPSPSFQATSQITSSS